VDSSISRDLLPLLGDRSCDGSCFGRKRPACLLVRTACKALADLETSDADSLKALRKVLEFRCLRTRIAAAHALARLGERGPAVVEALADGLAQWPNTGPISRDESSAHLALLALLDSGPEAHRLSPVLREVLNRKSSSWLHSLCIQALGVIGREDEEVAEFLRLRMRDGDLRVVAAGAYWRVTRDGSRCLQVLLEVIQDEPQPQRSLALRTLGDLGPEAEGGVSVLIGILRDSNDDRRREQALRTLARIGSGAAGAVPVLIEELQSPFAEDREAAVEAIASVGGQALPFLESALKSENEELTRDLLEQAMSRIAGD
jgi:HEAT repeat protein